jgi:hypothetical protein
MDVQVKAAIGCLGYDEDDENLHPPLLRRPNSRASISRAGIYK